MICEVSEIPVAVGEVKRTVADQLPGVSIEPGIVITPHCIDVPPETAVRWIEREIPLRARVRVQTPVPSGTNVPGTIAFAFATLAIASHDEFVMITVTVFAGAEELAESLGVGVSVMTGVVSPWVGVETCDDGVVGIALEE